MTPPADPNAPDLSAQPLRIAVVGCGAVTKASLLPVLAGHDGFSIAALVDRDERRARELAEAYGIARVLTDAGQLTRAEVDGLVLATPPAHHAPGTLDAAAKGLHVFVEKPLAMNAADARAMVEATDRAGVVLAVGLYRRFLPSVQLLRELIARGDFGRVISVDAEEGGPYGWQLATLDVLTREKGGGGTLIDLGTHVIDVVLFALNATPSLDRFSDNSRGGIETDCELHATLRTATGPVPFRLELSRTRELRGTIRVECEHATLELVRANFTEVIVHRRASAAGAPAPYRLAASWNDGREFIGYEAFRREFVDWLDAIRRRTDPVLSGRSVVPMVSLIEQAYASRVDQPEPWTDEGARAPAVRAADPLAGKRVLVTGAGGFLGARTVELLRDRFGCTPVALIREPKGAARLARWPGEVVLGDVCSRADMDRAMKGIDAVVHCAVGTSWQPAESRRVTVEGTRTAAEAALAAGVKRFVHISTLFVHQRDLGGTIDERTPLNPPASDDYGTAKLAAEKALEAVTAKGLSTIVLRPARIYGPFSKTFTVRPLQAMLENRFAISGDPKVPANMVFVDNVVEAIAGALNAPASRSGAAYLVNDPDQLSLLDFFGFFARLSGARIHLLPARETSASGTRPGWIAGLKTIALAPEVRALVHRILDTEPVGNLPKRLWEASPDTQRKLLKLFKVDAAVVYRPSAAGAEDLLDYWGENASVSSARLREELGVTPALTRDRAMALTLEWARAARLVPVEQPVAVGALV
ncbi:MAG: NAD-dependent epimerase/dehydratase family protein [Acidobacteria bacterium]|nr:NAD-dependent epimerase/dehydratase family protein [Acidobacteriota bacterium]